MTSSISAVDIGRVQVADSAQYVASILAAGEVRFSCVVVAPIPARQVAPQMRRMLWNRVKGGVLDKCRIGLCACGIRMAATLASAERQKSLATVAPIPSAWSWPRRHAASPPRSSNGQVCVSAAAPQRCCFDAARAHSIEDP
jgi:hypothetical protein